MRLAIVDGQEKVVVSWPDPREGRSEVARRAAAKVSPTLGRFLNSRSRLQAELPTLVEQAVDEAILELQAETARL